MDLHCAKYQSDTDFKRQQQCDMNTDLRSSFPDSL